MLSSIDESNKLVIEKIKSSRPFLMDVVQAKSVIKELNDKTLLHAGPPIEWHDMCDPMKGSAVGAALFEGWATSEDEAQKLLASGGVKFVPCHNVSAVGPMGGITSGNMPLLVVENKEYGNKAYCTMNEGIGKVLRFGAYDKSVIDRLTWMRDVLGPSLSQALKQFEDGMELTALMSRAITMGDEFHQRNIAASALFAKEIFPHLIASNPSKENLLSVSKFLSQTDQFFLNIAMAYCKSVMDAAKTVTEGTIVTTMARNGKDFGIKISGMGDTWFTAPCNTPQGLYFTGYSQEDANADIGDSAITETFGVGGFAMIAAPGVTKFLGAGGFADALNYSEEMSEICASNNQNFTIPTWDFKPISIAIDARLVVETGIEPVINTGIAHKKAGVGQIGAGTVRAPLACFEKALKAFANK